MVAPQPTLDETFRALSDPTRRAVVQALGRGPASVSELAKPFEMALPSFLQHLRVLEDCGLVTTRKTGRVRTCTLRAEPLAAAGHWLEAQRTLWTKRLDQLDDNLSASGLPLTSEDMARLDTVSALAEEYPGWVLSRQGAGRIPTPFTPVT